MQVYVKYNADKEGPVKSLRAFRRVPVKAGETVVVEIPFGPSEIDLFDPMTGKMGAPKGKYTLYYGGSSDESVLRKLNFKL